MAIFEEISKIIPEFNCKVVLSVSYFTRFKSSKRKLKEFKGLYKYAHEI